MATWSIHKSWAVFLWFLCPSRADACSPGFSVAYIVSPLFPSCAFASHLETGKATAGVYILTFYLSHWPRVCVPRSGVLGVFIPGFCSCWYVSWFWGRDGWEKHTDNTSKYPASLWKPMVLAYLFWFCMCRNWTSEELGHLPSMPFIIS